MTFLSTTPEALRRARTAIVRRLAVAGAVALAALGVSAASASAGADQSIEVRGGNAVFLDEGEILRAADQVRDGRGVRAYLATPTPDPLFSVTDEGAGGRYAYRNLSIREGTTVRLQVCYTNHLGNDVKCSRWQSAEA